MLHIVRSSYSFLRGYGMPRDFMKRAEEVGGTVVAADYCSTWGHVAWAEAGCKALGATLPAVCTLEKDPRHGLVTLIARDSSELTQLYKLVSLANDQFYYRPRIKWDQIEGVYALLDDALPCDMDAALRATDAVMLKPRTHEVYDRDNVTFVECNDVRYVRPENKGIYELVAGMQMTMGEPSGNPMHMLRRGEYLRMMDTYGVDITGKTTGQTDFKASLPLASLLQVAGDLESAIKRTPRWEKVKDDQRYLSRYEKEIALIKSKGFESYFLFVADVVAWARRRMLVGPGRGSAGGSLVCWLLSITEVDPILHGTLFERFIDPGRPDLPDIDIDFADSERDSVFGYLKNKYGDDRVARIGTMSELGGKSALNDVGRAYRIPHHILKSVTQTLDDLSQAQQGTGTAANALKWADPAAWAEYPELEQAICLEGIPRHTGVHAAGVIVAQEPIVSFGSVKDGVVSLDMKSAEKLGLMKLDALGLKTLSVLMETMQSVGRNAYELYDLPLDDTKVWEIFNDDKVTGVFQFEGQAVRGLMRRIKVGSFSDLCALTSLARPGPLGGGAADKWIDRKAGNEEWTAIIPALQDTYGLIVYQEQAMSIVRELAGFDEYDVNGFRRAIGKKDPIKLAGYRDQFLEGAAGKGLDTFALEDLWQQMEDFGSYAFNYSHAVAYSMISYYAAWCKANYPNEYTLAYLKHTTDEDHQKAMLREYGARNIAFFDPDRSQIGWSLQNGELVGGFTNVKGIGPKMAEQLVAMREANPTSWKDNLSASQLSRLNGETAFDDLYFFATNYRDVYETPVKFKIQNKIWQIEDIPAEKGDYTFLGRLTKIMEREKDGNHYALLFFSDDTGEMPCTVNRFKWGDFKVGSDGKPIFKIGLPYVVRGNIINDGRKWLFIEKARPLHDPPERTANQNNAAPRGPDAEPSPETDSPAK
jgi:DNA polymerase III alpha subunit